jgi:phage recombination protein Bet
MNQTATRPASAGTIPGTGPVTNLPAAQPKHRLSLVEKMAAKFSIEPEKLLTTLKATAFKQRDNTPISNEQMAALLIVADQYNLNPFLKQIYAFADKNGIVPIVGVDGWLALINGHAQFNGMSFVTPAEELWVTPEKGGQRCPPWIECVIHRKDREHATVIREYLDESYRPPFTGKNRDSGREYTIDGPWQSHTKRMLRNKAIIQAARVAFAFSGIADEDEADRIIEARQAQSGVWETVGPAGAGAIVGDVQSETTEAQPPQSRTQSVKDRVKASAKRPEPAKQEPPPHSFDDIMEALNAATTVAECDLAADFIRHLHDEGEQLRAHNRYVERLAELEGTENSEPGANG